MKPNALEIAAAVLIVILLVWVANWDPFGSRARLKAKVAASEAQAQVSTATAKAADQVAVKTIQITEKTHETVRTIQAAPGASAPIPDAVRRAWLAGLPDDPEPSSR